MLSINGTVCYVPLFRRACQFRDCISARITASTSSSSLGCIPNPRFILYAPTVSGKRFPPTTRRRTARLIRLQLYTCFSLLDTLRISIGYRNQNRFQRRKVFCYTDLYAAYNLYAFFPFFLFLPFVFFFSFFFFTRIILNRNNKKGGDKTRKSTRRTPCSLSIEPVPPPSGFP